MAIKRIEIFDMDGTLVCSLHRFRTDPVTGKIDLPFWIANDIPEKIAQDSLLPLADYYKACVADPEIYTIIATARVLKKADYDFIRDNLGLPDKIFGRVLGDHTKGVTLKTRALQFLRNLKQFREIPAHFHEDNIEYLKGVCDNLNLIGHYYPSKQGV